MSVDKILDDLEARLSDPRIPFTKHNGEIGSALSDIAVELSSRITKIAGLSDHATPTLGALSIWIQAGIAAEKEGNSLGAESADRHLLLGSILRVSRNETKKLNSREK